MKIVATGGLSYVGIHIVVDLIRHKHKILVLDNLSNSELRGLKSLEQITGIALAFVKCSTLNKKALTNIFKNFSPEVVVNLAGLKSVEESISKPLGMHTTT